MGLKAPCDAKNHLLGPESVRQHRIQDELTRRTVPTNTVPPFDTAAQVYVDPYSEKDFGKVFNSSEDKATRHDTGKAPMHLLPPDALFGLAQVYAFGAKKYAPRNWEKGMEWSRVYDSLQRHLLAFWAGEDTDQESGLPHVDHIVWNAVTLSAYQKRVVGEDDRPHPQPAPPSEG